MRAGEHSLDMTTINELREMLEEGLDELFNEYLADAPLQLARLSDAVELNDIEAITSIAHTLKGSSGNLGIRGVSELSAKLEQEARSGTLKDVNASIAAIGAELAAAKAALAELVAD